MTMSEIRLPTALIVVAALLYVLSCGNVAIADTYADSAHGSAAYGVNRPSADHPTGDCAHCHDSLDDSICGVNQYMLFFGTQTACDQICFECHGASYASEQQINNYPYGILFGGFSTLYFESILHQFCSDQTHHTNCGSRHSLTQIWSVIKDNTLDWGFSANPNPCSACHNPHLSQRIGSTQYRPPYDPTKSPITRPSERYNNPLNLWGDDASERIDQYAGQFTDGEYQAPYYGSFESGLFEPAGDATSDGSNLPDYVTFCLDCHQYAQYDPERGKNVKAINYAMERHGGYPSNTCTNMGFAEGDLRAPYVDVPNSNYVLSCLDCHEPHGTLNRMHLIRRVINGQVIPANDTAGGCEESPDFAEICLPCHDWPHPAWGGCTGCHGEHNSGDWHGSTFPFGSGTDNCLGEPSF
jgi:hypothetical protein